MRRVLVIGSGGAGKSTFAKRLGKRISVPVVHLDALYWREGWTEAPSKEWHATIDRLLAGEEWVMDGNYGGTLDQRLGSCDTVVFLDIPRRSCLWRAVKRRIRFHGRSRPDMNPGCPERLTWEFVRWIWTYPVERRPPILQRLSKLRSDQTAIVLHTDREVEDFLQSIPGSAARSKR